jgi:selenium metabolism protein YedF
MSILSPANGPMRAAADRARAVSGDDSSGTTRTALLLLTDTLGQGDIELGHKLMLGFLRTTLDASPRPWRVLLVNHGVRMATVDDVAVDALQLLGERGVEILACGTCLEHLGLTERLRAGRVSNMFEIVETLNTADKVVSIG